VAVLLAAGACPRRAYGRATPGGPCAELGRRAGRRAQVHRLSTDFRKATRIVSERVPSAAELPAGARSAAITSLARSGGAPGRLHGRPRARLGVLCCTERRKTVNVPQVCAHAESPCGMVWHGDFTFVACSTLRQT